ncbi:MAG: thiamine pyrophosphate-binding protein [Nocardioidaceae bacterium]
MNPTAHPPTERATAPLRTGRGADLLVEALVRSGVTHLFGVPGDTGVVFYDALAASTDRITHVLARDERHAAAMADAYARAANEVGVVEVSSGGGTTYVVGGLGEAFASGTPVLLVTSDIHRGSRGTGALTEIDQRALFSAVTKRVIVVDSAAEIPAAVRDALDTATSGRPGPVAVVVPEDVLDEEVDVDDNAFGGSVGLPRTRPVADRDLLARAADALAAAERPALLVGAGVHVSQAYDEVELLAEHLGAGVATTIHGKGTIADSNRWALGVTGNNGGGPVAAGCLADADVVLVVGSRANATDTDSFTAPGRGATVIALDIDPSIICRNYPDAIPLAGDARTVLQQLRAAVPERDTVQVASRHDRIRLRRDAQVRSPAPDAPAGKLLVDDVVDAVAAVLDGLDPIVVADPGAPTPATADRFPVTRAGRGFVVPRGHGPMGFALPAAVGVAVAYPDRPVLALTADGSFAMSCGELETIARLELPVIGIQFTNHSLGWIKMLQHLYQDERYFGVDPGPIDAVAVARACGLRAHRPTTIEEVREQVTSALRDRVAVYLDVEVPHMIDVVPQVPAWHRALNGDRVRPVY